MQSSVAFLVTCARKVTPFRRPNALADQRTHAAERKMIKKLLLGLAATTAFTATPALAADLPSPPAATYYKAPPMAPVFSWTGCYVGADVGGGFVRDSDHELTGAGGPSPFSPAPTNIANSDGVMAGGFLGCNYQFSNGIVIGAEGDANWANIRGGTAAFPGSA